MYCKTHGRYFHPHQVCFACESENRVNWVDRNEPSEEDKQRALREDRELEIVLLRQENEHLKEAGKDLDDRIRKVRDEKDEVERLSAMQKTKADSLGQAYRDALDREEVAKKKLEVCAVKKDFYAERVKILYEVLERHFHWCSTFEEGERAYKSTVLVEEAKKALKLRWNATSPESLKGKYLTGLVPSGGIETHLALCQIWGHSYSFEKVCTCKEEKESE